jgi:hypothetical protein
MVSQRPIDPGVVLGDWLASFDAHAPGVVEGLYVVGSLAFDNWRGGSDIDIVAVLAEPPDEATVEALRRAHFAFRDQWPAPDVDGPFVAWGDLSVPAMAVARPWVLGGDFFHDAECFELNPVTWYVLGSYGIDVRGPDPRTLGIPSPVIDRVDWVRGNVASYWRGQYEFVRVAAQREADAYPASVLAWCVLGMLRMRYTIMTGDVTSKAGAARHALETGRSRWRPIAELALELHESGVASATITHEELVAALRLMEDVLGELSV